MTIKAYIRGLGRSVPDNVVTNGDLEKIVDTSDEWITTRTGIKQRHISSGEVASDLGAEAGKQALAQAGVDPEELTHIICATCSPDYTCPNTATQIEHKIGTAGCMAFDLNAACSGFLYGLHTAKGFLAVQPDSKILLAATEIISSRTNWEDRTTCVLFGDGSGAAYISGEKGEDGIEIVDCLLESDGQFGELLTIKGGGSATPYKLGDTVGENHFVNMNGREVFKVAVRNMTSACNRLLERNGMTLDDVDMLITHQANMRIIEAVGKKLKMPQEKVFTNVERYGNTSAASIGIALSEGLDQGVLKPGMTVLTATFGGGFTWGASLLQF